MVIRLLIGVSAALGAVNVFLLGYPGDVVPQAALLVVGALDAGLGALAAFMLTPDAALKIWRERPLPEPDPPV